MQKQDICLEDFQISNYSVIKSKEEKKTHDVCLFSVS